LEELLGDSKYCVGDKVSMADVYLVPQVYNAIRFNIDMTKYPKISRVYDNACKIEAFRLAEPSMQPDSK
jgi:glutathione S-transferase